MKIQVYLRERLWTVHVIASTNTQLETLEHPIWIRAGSTPALGDEINGDLDDSILIDDEVKGVTMMKKMTLMTMVLVTMMWVSLMMTATHVSASVPTTPTPAVTVEYGVIVGLEQSRHDDNYHVVTFEVADGNIFANDTVVDDYCIGDIVLVQRFNSGTPDDPTDDWTHIQQYVGYEQWFPFHCWYIWDRSIGQYTVTVPTF